MERSDALVYLTENFEAVGIPRAVAHRMAFERLYNGWPDFYSPDGMLLDEALEFGRVEATGQELVLDDSDVDRLMPPPSTPTIPTTNEVTESLLLNPKPTVREG